jgi:DNA-binding PucR family transcriptional regulator
MVNINELQNKINILEEKIGPILDDFKKYYFFYNTNPDYDEYQRMYDNLKSDLLSINNEILDISRNTNNKIVDINDSFLKINKVIEEERNKNKRLKSIENDIKHDYNGSEIMINEYKQKYNKYYTINVLMLLGIIISTITLIKVFTKNEIK